MKETLTTELENNLQAKAPATTQRPRRNWLRWGLWCFVLLAAGLSGGLLFLQKQMTQARTMLVQEAHARYGARMALGPVRLLGLQGFQVDGFQLLLEGEEQIHGSISVPQINIYIDLIDLLYGELNIKAIELDRALLHLRKGDGGAAVAEPFSLEKLLPTVAGATAGEATEKKPGELGINFPAFRVIGKECRIKLYGFTGETPLQLGNLSFDITRQRGAQEYFARLNAELNSSKETQLDISARFAHASDFDARLLLSKWDAGDFLRMGNPAGFFLESGIVSPSLRISGFPNEVVMLAMDIPFSDMKVVGQPESIETATGSLSGLAQLNLRDRVLTVNAARLKSNQLSGAVEGEISFAAGTPEMHFAVSTDKLPVQDMLRMAFQFVPEYAQRLSIEVGDTYEVRMLFDGPVSKPEISVQARAASGKVRMEKSAETPVGAELEFGAMDLRWKSGQKFPDGSIYVNRGQVELPFENLRLDNINARLALESGKLMVDPLQCTLLGNVFQARGNYDIEGGNGDYLVSAQIARLEDTPLGDGIKDLKLANAVQFECEGTIAPDEYSAKLRVNATETRIGFEWWFEKPPGIGATIHELSATYVPGKPVVINGDADLATSKLKALIELRPQAGGAYALHTLRVDAAEIDAVTAGKCLNIPYTLTGGRATSGYYERVPVEGDKPGAHFGKIGGHVSSLSGLPDGLEIPIHLKEADVEVVLDNSSQKESNNSLTVNSKYAEVPSLEYRWLLPLRSETEEPETPPIPENWVFNLTAENIVMPPWQGANFKAQAYDIPGEAGLREFAVDVESGKLNGSYRSQKEDNVYFLDAVWDQVPATFILEHLGLPQACQGPSTGEVHYSMDTDDPGTLKGTGNFDIQNGQFSADYLIELFGSLLEEDLVTLPTSMKFSKFSGDVEMSGDTVFTKNVVIDTEGMVIKGEGSYIMEGDLDYNLRVALSPDTAMRIPVLRDSFNLRGHKFTQNELTLGFHIVGPMFNPTGSVNELPPVGVTFFSGAAETTAEALSVIDIPRKILLDLFKIGGGIAASQRENRQSADSEKQ